MIVIYCTLAIVVIVYAMFSKLIHILKIMKENQQKMYDTLVKSHNDLVKRTEKKEVTLTQSY